MFMNDPFIVAEISANHLGSFDNAVQLVRCAKEAGADAVKLQTYTPDEIAANMPITTGPWSGIWYHDLYTQAMTPWEWHEPLFDLIRSLGMVPFSSPFSERAVEMLESIGCPIYKIASPEICYHQLIAAAADTGKPLIISTGMATLAEIYNADSVATCHGAIDTTFLHCISAYPARAKDFNLATMVRMAHHNFKVGLSDHSLDSTAAAAAVALGATVIEKHLCLSRSAGGPDAKFSLEPLEFAAMVEACRHTKEAMGEVVFGCRDSEASSYKHRRSIWLVKDIKKGEIITEDHLAILRPNYGLPPAAWEDVVGKTARVDISLQTPLSMDMLKWFHSTSLIYREYVT